VQVRTKNCERDSHILHIHMISESDNKPCERDTHILHIHIHMAAGEHEVAMYTSSGGGCTPKYFDVLFGCNVFSKLHNTPATT